MTRRNVTVADHPDIAAAEAELGDAVLRWMVETKDVVPWEAALRRPADLLGPIGHR